MNTLILFFILLVLWGMGRDLDTIARSITPPEPPAQAWNPLPDSTVRKISKALGGP